ncbi:hypothetical protein M9458_001977, partial [Cirrhinus mrigala]
MVKQTLSSTLDSDLPDVTSLNLLDEESAPKNKAQTPVSPKDPMRKKGTGWRERGRLWDSQTPCTFMLQLFSRKPMRTSPKGDDDDDSGIADDSDTSTKQNEHWAYELAFNTLK